MGTTVRESGASSKMRGNLALAASAVMVLSILGLAHRQIQQAGVEDAKGMGVQVLAPKDELLHWHPHFHIHWPHIHIHLSSVLKRIAHGFEKDVKKVEHWVSQIPQKLDGELVKLENDFKDLARSARKVLKSIGTFIKNFQPWLVRLNSRIFGPVLGPLLEKLELAGIEAIPGVGTAVKILVDGVNIYDDVKNMEGCFKTKDYDCVGKDLLGVLTTVDGIMVDNFSGMKSVITGINDAVKVVKGGLEVEEAIEKDFPKLKEAFQLMDAKPLKADHVITAVYDLSVVTGDIGGAIMGADNGIVKKWTGASKKLKELVAISTDVQAAYVAGKDIMPELKTAKNCWHHHDFTCVGKQIAAILNEVDGVIMDHFTAVKGVANALANVADGINVAIDTEQAFKDMEAAFKSFETKPLSAAAVETGMKQLSAASSAFADEVKAANRLLGGKIANFADKCEHVLHVISNDAGEADKVLVMGIDVAKQMKAAAACWRAKDYSCVAMDIENMANDVEEAAGQFDSLKKFSAAMAKVSTAAEISADVVQTWHDLEAFGDDLKVRPFTVTQAQKSLRDLTTALDGMKGELAKLKSITGTHVGIVVDSITKHIDSVEVVDGKINTALVCWTDVGADLQDAHTAWNAKPKDFRGLGNAVSALVESVESTINSLFPNMKKLVAGLASVDDADKLALSSMKTYKDIEAAFKELEQCEHSSVSECESSVRSGLAALASALKTINPELKDFNTLAGARADKIVARLEQGVSDVEVAEGKITKVVVDALNIGDVVQKLATDSKAHNWVKMGEDLKALYEALTTI